VLPLQKYLFNPVAKSLVGLGLLPTTAVIETRGRLSGKRRRTPVGNGLDRATGTFWIVAEHGRRASWVRNVEIDPRVRLRVGRRWLAGTAHPMPDDDPRERQRSLARKGLGPRITAAAVRVWGTDLLTVRVDLDHSSNRSPR
jgi:deazaflavin-dependent oxidoreductase (nitroreductase family)